MGVACLLIILLSQPLNAEQAPARAVKADTPAAGDKIFGVSTIHQIYITLSAAEWSMLQTSTPRNGGGTAGTDSRQPDSRLVHTGSGFGGYFPWAHADVRMGGAEFKGVGLRYKGNSTFQLSSSAAPLFANFKLKIDAYGTKGSWDEEKTFNLHAGVIDTSKMREAIAYAVFRGAGVPAPRTAYAEMYFTVPGLYQDVSAGLFTLIEDVNMHFFERVLPPGTGLVMKPEGLRGGIQSLGDNWEAYVPRFRPDRDATPHERQRVMEFARLVSQPDVALFKSKIDAYLDVEEFLRFIAVNALLANWDSYVGGSHNYFLYLDPTDDKFRFIPWDMDLSMGGRGLGPANRTIDIARPVVGEQPLICRLLDDPAMTARYRAIVRQLSSSVYSKTELLKLVDTLEKVGTGRGPSPRPFIESQTALIEQVVAGWGK